MKQREHASLDGFANFEEILTARTAQRDRQAKLPKHANEATQVLTIFEIAAAGRISEKGAAFGRYGS
jgi:hypothetical protein